MLAVYCEKRSAEAHAVQGTGWDHWRVAPHIKKQIPGFMMYLSPWEKIKVFSIQTIEFYLFWWL